MIGLPPFFKAEELVAKDAIYVSEEMAYRISVATFWIEGHDAIHTAIDIAVRAGATVFRSFWECQEEAGQFTLSILPFRKRPVPHITPYEVANVSWVPSVEVIKIGRNSKRVVTNDGISHHLLDEPSYLWG